MVNFGTVDRISIGANLTWYSMKLIFAEQYLKGTFVLNSITEDLGRLLTK